MLTRGLTASIYSVGKLLDSPPPQFNVTFFWFGITITITRYDVRGCEILAYNGIKEPLCGSQNFHTKQILIFGGYVKVEKIFVYLILWVNVILTY
jgi:hypothetical protein